MVELEIEVEKDTRELGRALGWEQGRVSPNSWEPS